MSDAIKMTGPAYAGPDGATEAAGRDNSLPISVTSLVKSYGAFRALDNVSIDIQSGEFMTLLGPSGSGKTTLLMVLAGFVRPDSGSVKFGDDEILLLPPHKRDIGMVFQNYALFPHMTVAENLAYPLKLRSTPKTEIRERVARALDLVQLTELGDRGIDALSGGQRQRVALARAVIFEPRILLMDEPLSALDKNLREQMQFEVRALHDRLGITTVYVTHDQREALTMSDRIAVINEGRIQQVDPPQRLYERPETFFVASFIGETYRLPVEVENGAASLFGQPIRTEGTIASARRSQTLILRPEMLHIAGGLPGEDENQMTGTLRKTVFQGDSVVSYITIHGDHEIAVRSQHRSNQSLPEPGSEVRLSWLVQDTVILAEEDRE
ncbi:ABC transporter ATP-binding protein [Roseovarius sp. S4756]|uniref:ABC transporter ATP-binding protein n=1 Tax=Roseovarius maritimus TaxID=3342637 RepID=UPI003727BDB6